LGSTVSRTLRALWKTCHHDRNLVAYARRRTTWLETRSKPIWFTEYGCAAWQGDKPTQQVSSTSNARKSSLPAVFDRRADELMQCTLSAGDARHLERIAEKTPLSQNMRGAMVI